MTYKDLEQKVSDMPSYILSDDFIIYHKYLPLIRKGETIIDIGTGWGKSVTAMALMNSNIYIWTIDDGSYPLYQRWAKDKNDYKNKLRKEFKNHGVKNVSLLIGDVIKLGKVNDSNYSLVHIDLTKEKEIEGLQAWLPRVALGGLALIRNFERLKDNIEDLLIDFEYIEKSGLIYVYRRIK